MPDQNSRLNPQNCSQCSKTQLLNDLPQNSDPFLTIQAGKSLVQPMRNSRQMRQGLLSGICLSLLLLTTPARVVADAGHGSEEFSGGEDATKAQPIEIDAKTVADLGIKVEPVTLRRLAFGIQTTGQIETLPNQKVEVTTPIQRGTVMKLLVEPGASVRAGQAVAILSSPELAELRVDSLEKRAEAQGDVQEAQANLRLAQQNFERQRQLAAADLQQARTQSAFAQERYSKDRVLAAEGALPRRQAFESSAQLAEAKAAETRTASRGDVLEAAAQLKRAQSAVTVAQSRLNLSSTGYQTRLEQLGASANPDGTVTVTAPISGKVADREATPGESFEEAGEPLMTLQNDTGVLAAANVYEKDLSQVKAGQQIRVTTASLPNRIFQGQVTQIGAVLEGETRVLPVKAELNNPGGALKPGMFAKLNILTDRTSEPALAVSGEALVDANGKELVFVQKGNTYQPVEVTVGRNAGDLVEVKSGLSDGDRIVTQGTTLLYAQSLRGGETKEGDEHADEEAANSAKAGLPLPWWLMVPIVGGFAGGIFWLGRRTKPPIILRDPDYKDPGYKDPDYESASNQPPQG